LVGSETTWLKKEELEFQLDTPLKRSQYKEIIERLHLLWMHPLAGPLRDGYLSRFQRRGALAQSRRNDGATLAVKATVSFHDAMPHRAVQRCPAPLLPDSGTVFVSRPLAAAVLRHLSTPLPAIYLSNPAHPLGSLPPYPLQHAQDFVRKDTVHTIGM